MSLIMPLSLLALTFFSIFMALLKKISACCLPKLILNSHLCFERPITVEVATFSPF